MQPAAQPRRVLVGGSGDVLFHTRVVESASANGGFDHLFHALRAVIADEEIAFVNLETPLSVERTPMRDNPPRLGAPPEAAAALARAGIDVVSVANNHAWDQRDTGMVQTLEALRGAGIVPVGAAPEEEDAPGPVLVERHGVRVAFLAFTEILQGHPGTRRPAVRIALYDARRARRAVEAARAEADVVVASVHWGLGYRHDDRLEQRTIAERLVEWGVDVILGSGPHVLQRAEVVSSPRGQAFVAYSLGNFISNQGYVYRRGVRERGVEVPLREPATRDGVWMRVAIDIAADGRIAIGGAEGVPLWTQNNYWAEERDRALAPDIHVSPLSQLSDAELSRERRRAIQEVLGDAVHLLE
jgi:poly-gamma-glutamate synthesis protein (capsule biosynthesis protein)